MLRRSSEVYLDHHDSSAVITKLDYILADQLCDLAMQDDVAMVKLTSQPDGTLLAEVVDDEIGSETVEVRR